MPRLWEGRVLLKNHQLDKGNLAGCRSPADPARGMPTLADLLNHAKDVGGTYKLGHVGTGEVVLSPAWDTKRKHVGFLAHLEHPLTCQPWDISPCLLSAWKGKTTRKDDPLLHSCRCLVSTSLSLHLSPRTSGFCILNRAFLLPQRKSFCTRQSQP